MGVGRALEGKSPGDRHPELAAHGEIEQFGEPGPEVGDAEQPLVMPAACDMVVS